MKHYIDRDTNEVFAYELDGSQDSYISSHLELLSNEEFESIKESQKPTTAELNAIADINRQLAYVAEADPLFFKYQRKEVTKKTWTDKIEEIKTRFPKMEE